MQHRIDVPRSKKPVTEKSVAYAREKGFSMRFLPKDNKMEEIAIAAMNNGAIIHPDGTFDEFRDLPTDACLWDAAEGSVEVVGIPNCNMPNGLSDKTIMLVNPDAKDLGMDYNAQAAYFCMQPVHGAAIWLRKELITTTTTMRRE